MNPINQPVGVSSQTQGVQHLNRELEAPASSINIGVKRNTTSKETKNIEGRKVLKLDTFSPPVKPVLDHTFFH